MAPIKPYVLSIAGFDPSGGAGILSDIKTIEANGGYGFGVVTAITCQNDIAFEKVKWLLLDEIIEQAEVLQKRFTISYIKIGLIESLEVLDQLLSYIKQKMPDAVIVWDPILKASAGFVFHSCIANNLFEKFFKKITCITPNIPEANLLFGAASLTERLLAESDYCTSYIKGGHADNTYATDVLYYKHQTYSFANPRLPSGQKHGSGCVLSAALTTQLARGEDMPTAAEKANRYVHQFLASNETLLGYHLKNYA